MTGFVYFLRAVGIVGPVKIGHSLNPEKRRATFERHSPYELEVAFQLRGDVALERRIQRSLGQFHIRKEWFQPVPQVIKLIKALQAGVLISEAIDLKVVHPFRLLPILSPQRKALRSYRQRVTCACQEGPLRIRIDPPWRVVEILNDWEDAFAFDPNAASPSDIGVVDEFISSAQFARGRVAA